MKFPVLIACLMFIIGCAKEPGIGGKAEIHGRVLEQHHNNSGELRGEPYPRADVRVYISYGDGYTTDDDVRTGPDGRFRFPWLRKGTYRVFATSECFVEPVECPGGTFSVTRLVELTGRKDLEDIGDLLIENH